MHIVRKLKYVGTQSDNWASQVQSILDARAGGGTAVRAGAREPLRP